MGTKMRPILHRDGSVTYWSVYRQVWCRHHTTLVEDQEYAAMSAADRQQVLKHMKTED